MKFYNKTTEDPEQEQELDQDKLEQQEAEQRRLLSVCPLCNETPPSISIDIANEKYPIVCSSKECHYNLCSPCTTQLLVSSCTTTEASDGNEYDVKLQCPNSRSKFAVNLQDVLLLRRYNVWYTEIKNTNDADLSASELREKYYWYNEQRIKEYNIVKRRYTSAVIAAGKQLNYTEEEEQDAIVDAPNNQYKKFQKKQNQEKLMIKKEMDAMMLLGLEDSISDSERTYIVSLFNSGSTEKLVQAVQLLHSIVEMRKTPPPRTKPNSGKTVSTVTSSPNIHQNFSSADIKTTMSSPNLSAVTQSMSVVAISSSSSSSSGGSDTMGYTKGGISSSSVTARNLRKTNKNTILKKNNKGTTTLPTITAISINMKRTIQHWKYMYPLPVRMPHVYTISLNFDPTSLWNATIYFIDDLQSFTRLPSDEANNTVSHHNGGNTLERLIKDSFEPLHVSSSRWSTTTTSRITKLPIAKNHIGYKNILGANSNKRSTSGKDQHHHTLTSACTESGNIETTIIPQHPQESLLPPPPLQRIVISSVKGQAMSLGVQVGDVITHVNGQVYNGNAESLRNFMIQKRNKSENPKIDLIVNAEMGTAETLRRRSVAINIAMDKM